MIERIKEIGERSKVEIDLGELIDAFGNCRIGYQYYLDTVPGEILHTCDEWMDTEEIEKIDEQIEMEPERYLSIPTDSSREGYRALEAFTDTVEDENLKEKLWIALDGRGAFRRFKDVLSHYPDEREKWFEFKNERLKNRVLEWLEENEIELEEK
jgi:hypothetical protein